MTAMTTTSVSSNFAMNTPELLTLIFAYTNKILATHTTARYQVRLVAHILWGPVLPDHRGGHLTYIPVPWLKASSHPRPHIEPLDEDLMA